MSNTAISLTRRRAEVISIFTNVEETAANIFIKDGKAIRIEMESIPLDMRVDYFGSQVRFGIVIEVAYIPGYKALVARLFK